MLFGTALWNIRVRYFIDHNNTHTNAMFISGLARGGTTWLAQLLNYRNDSRFIYEPFFPEHVALAASFRDHQYLRPDDDDRRFLAPARAIVTGLIRDPFVDKHNRRILCDRRIIKEIHANLFVRWLYEHFPGMPIVLLVRHPFAVAASRLALGVDIDLGEVFFSQQQLVHDYLSEYRSVIRACTTPFERQVAAACIEIGVPLSQFKTGEICVVFYEQLCQDPARILAEVFSHLGRPFDRRVCDHVTRPSHTTLSRRKLRDDWKLGSPRVVGAWKDSVSSTQMRRGSTILSMFGLDTLYGDDPMPHAVGQLPLPFGGPTPARVDVANA